MVVRKIISLGSSLAITLPRVWTQNNNLEKGDTVNYEIQGNHRLLITPVEVERSPSELVLIVDESLNTDKIIRGIIAGFLNGYYYIQLNSKTVFTPEQRNLIREATSRFYMMIVKADASKITLQTLLDETNTPVIASVERIHIITSAMYKDILQCMNEPNRKLLESVVTLEDDVDQLKFLISRLIRVSVSDPSIASRQALGPLDCLDYQALVNRVERIADHLTNIAVNLLKLSETNYFIPVSVRSTFVKAAGNAFRCYETAMQSFIMRDLSHTEAVIENENEIIRMFGDVTPLPLNLNEEEKSTIPFLIQIRESIRKISHYSSDIAEITINQTYKHQ